MNTHAIKVRYCIQVVFEHHGLRVTYTNVGLEGGRT